MNKEQSEASSKERILHGEDELQLRKVYLSLSPRPLSGWTAAAFVFLILGFSQFHWSFTLGPDELGLAPTGESVFQGMEYWRLLTGTFIHSDLLHLFSNLLPFSILAFLIYGYFGMTVTLVCILVLGPLTHALSLLTYHETVRLVGASGLVYLMAGVWLSLYFLIDRRLTVFDRLMRVCGISLIFLLPASAFEVNISHRTHGIGFVFGVAFGGLIFLLKKEVFRNHEVYEKIAHESEWPKQEQEPEPEPEPEPEQLAVRADAEDIEETDEQILKKHPKNEPRYFN